MTCFAIPHPADQRVQLIIPAEDVIALGQAARGELTSDVIAKASDSFLRTLQSLQAADLCRNTNGCQATDLGRLVLDQLQGVMPRWALSPA